MSKAASLTNQYFSMRNKSSKTLSKMIKDFFNRNKAAKIGTIEENKQIVQITQDDIDIDIDSSNTSIQEASPTDILFELDKKTKPASKLRTSRTSTTSKKTASISGGNSRKSKTPKTPKTPKSKTSKTLKKYKNKK